MNIKEYSNTYNGLVDDVLAEIPEDFDHAMDLLHEFVDGSQHVIYYEKAWDLVKYLRDNEPLELQEYESLAAELGREPFESLNHYCTVIAYWALFEPARSLLEKELEELV